MKTLAVLSPLANTKVDSANKYLFEVDSFKIPISMIEVPDTEFDDTNPKNEFSVLVKKKGFSLNYRDIGAILLGWHYLNKSSDASFYPIGSDFCGEVIEIGKKVKNVSVGDRVIPDCFYPDKKEGFLPGVPTNHASKQLEIIPSGKLMRIPKTFPLKQAVASSIGTQTAMNMIKEAAIEKNFNVLVTSPTSNTSLFILNFLRNIKCNLYCLSYSNSNIEFLKKEFPAIKKIFSFKSKDIPGDLFFDVVLDPFSDTYLPYLIGVSKISVRGKYITCGVFSQSSPKIQEASSVKLAPLLGQIIMKDIHLIGNCLGPSNALEDGIRDFMDNDESKVLIDRVYSQKDDIGDFLERTFKNNSDRFGKVVYMYETDETVLL